MTRDPVDAAEIEHDLAQSGVALEPDVDYQIDQLKARHDQMDEQDSRNVAVIPNTPMAMLALAVSQGADLDRLQKLMDLQERWEKGEAKKAFVTAMAAFKANPPTVYKDKENKQYDSMYTTIGNLVNTVNASMSKHGLSANWEIDQSNGITVTCILTHERGHSERCSMSGPPDDSGKKNPLQQIKSTITYLKAATFEAITGTASSEANMDDDANGSGAKPGKLPLEEFEAWKKRIESATTKETAKAQWQLAVKACQKLDDVESANALKSVMLAHADFIEAANKKEVQG